MDKTWFSNNLGTVGKWGGGSFLFGMIITSFVFGQNLPLRAYILNPVFSSHQATELKLNYNPISKINDITAPVNKQNMDFSKFFSSSRVSSNDIMSFLKEAAVTAINLTLLVISITAQVLKGILSVFKQ